MNDSLRDHPRRHPEEMPGTPKSVGFAPTVVLEPWALLRFALLKLLLVVARRDLTSHSRINMSATPHRVPGGEVLSLSVLRTWPQMLPSTPSSSPQNAPSPPANQHVRTASSEIFSSFFETDICSVFLRVAVVTFEAPLQDLQRVVGVDDLEIDGTDLFPHSSPAGSRFQHSGTSMSSTALRLPRSYVSTVLTGRLKGFPPMCRQWNSFTPEVSLLFSFTLFPAGSS